MGWSSETYRYRQYKNALEYVQEHRGSLDLKAKIEPRKDFTLLDTLLEGLRELVREYEAVAILEPELEHDDVEIPHCKECQHVAREPQGDRGTAYFCGSANNKHIPGRYTRTSPLWCPKRRKEK